MKKVIAFCLSLFLPFSLSGDSSSIIIMGNSVGGAAAPASAPSYVTSATANSTGATGVVLTINSGEGFIGCARVGSNVTSTVTDDTGDFITELRDVSFDGANNHFVLFYSTNATAGSRTITITPSSGSPSVRAIIHSVSNLKAGNPVDDDDFGTDSSNDVITSPTLTTTETNTYLFSCGMVTGSQNFTWDGSHTERQEVVQKISTADRSATSSGSYSATYNTDSPDGLGISYTAFKGQS